jgi:hypothetical protein
MQKERVKGYVQWRGNKPVKVSGFTRKVRKSKPKPIKKMGTFEVTYFIDGNGQLVSKRIYKKVR